MKYSMYQVVFKIIIVSVLVISFFACDEHIVTEFRTETDFTMSEFDAQACYMLSRDTVRVDTLINGPDTTVTETRQYLSVTLTEFSVQEWVDASDSLVNALFDTLLTDTTCVVRNPEVLETGYTLYEQSPGRSSTLVIFVSWELDDLNRDTYINIDLFKKDGSKLTLQTQAMDLETIAGCSQTFESGSGLVTLPSIRSRLTFSVPEGTYLVKCYFTKPESMDNFRMVIF